jgi:hypothetical protein
VKNCIIFSSEPITQRDIYKKKQKLDKFHQLYILNGDNNSVEFQTGLSSADMHDIKNDIMRRVKFEQLKKMRMSDFRRRAKNALRQKKLSLRDRVWSESDRQLQVKQFK